MLPTPTCLGWPLSDGSLWLPGLAPIAVSHLPSLVPSLCPPSPFALPPFAAPFASLCLPRAPFRESDQHARYGVVRCAGGHFVGKGYGAGGTCQCTPNIHFRNRVDVFGASLPGPPHTAAVPHTIHICRSTAVAFARVDGDLSQTTGKGAGTFAPQNIAWPPVPHRGAPLNVLASVQGLNVARGSSMLRVCESNLYMQMGVVKRPLRRQLRVGFRAGESRGARAGRLSRDAREPAASRADPPPRLTPGPFTPPQRGARERRPK